MAEDKDGNPITHGVKIFNPQDGTYLGIVSHIEGEISGNYNLKTMGTDRTWKEFDPSKVTTKGRPWNTTEDLTFEGLEWDEINAKLAEAYPSVKFEIDESMELDVSQEYARLVSRIFNRFPMLQHSMDSVTTQARSGGAFASVGSAPQERATHPHQTMNLNSILQNKYGRAVPTTMERLVQDLKGGQADGWFHKVEDGKELEVTISHETAHALDGLTGWLSDDRLVELIEKYLEGRTDRGQWGLMQYLIDHNEVSRYSFGSDQLGIDTSEFVAEAFSDVDVNGINAKPLSKYIHMEIIARLKGLTNDWA
jgi:hypothetical protein